MRCTNDVLMNKITNNKLNKDVELFLTVLNDLPDCKRIKADRYVKVVDGSDQEVASAPIFNKYLIPDNAFECDREACLNTGTLYLGDDEYSAIYRLPYDAVEFSSGVITFYVTGYTGAKNVTVSVSDSENFTNADVYTLSITGKANEFTPVVVDLSTTPTSTEGTGWTATHAGAYLKINVADDNAGFSSITIFDSKDDFRTSDVVVLGCLTEIGGDEEFDETDSTCWVNGYDTNADNAKEVPITAHSVSKNYYKLNPRYGKGTAVTGWKSKNIEVTPTESGNYAVYAIDDMDMDACGFVGADSKCDHLERIAIPVPVALDVDQFNVVPNEDGTVTFYFNKDLAGQTVKITYPQTEENIEERVYSDKNIGAVKVKAEQIVTQSDGTKIVRVFDNVLVTSFPGTINEDETEFSFTLSIRRGANGHRYREYVISK